MSDSDISSGNISEVEFGDHDEATFSPEIIPATPPLPRPECVSHVKRLFQSSRPCVAQKSIGNRPVSHTPQASQSLAPHRGHSDPRHLAGSVLERNEPSHQSPYVSMFGEILGELKDMNHKLSDVTNQLGVVEGRLQGLEESSATLSSDASVKKKKEKIPLAVRVRFCSACVYSVNEYNVTCIVQKCM